MIPVSLTFPGFLIESYTVNIDGEWVSSTQSFPTTARNFGISGGPMIKGDFKHPNPWSYIRTDIRGFNGSYLRKDRASPQSFGVEGHVFGADPLAGSAWTTYRAQVIAAARTKCIEKLNDRVRGSLDLATSLAESGQTIKMLNLTQRFTDLVSDMKRSWKREILNKLRSWKSRRRAQKDLDRWQRGLKSRSKGAYRPVRVTPGLIARVSNTAANGWLEFTYGLKPLMADIYGVATNVVGRVKNFVNSYYAKVRENSVQNLTHKFSFDGRNWASRVKCVVSVGYSMYCRLKQSDPLLARWTSLNPLAVGYELLPYSFVFDWFLNIGGYMRGLETALRYSSNFVSGYQSLIVGTRISTSIAEVQRTPGVTYAMRGGGSREDLEFSRSILSSYPAPGFPTLSVDLGSGRLLSAAALLRQML